jgi:hypothetical protein
MKGILMVIFGVIIVALAQIMMALGKNTFKV